MFIGKWRNMQSSGGGESKLMEKATMTGDGPVYGRETSGLTGEAPRDNGLTATAGLLAAADRNDIPYVSWKNNHELDAYLEGDGDMDVVVAPEHRAAFMALAFSDGWGELENPLAQFPWVCHLFRVGAASRVYHLHVYFRLVTGESWLKEYVLPLEKFLLENRVRADNSGVWVLDDQVQRYMFALRHLLKGGSISSRSLYRRELSSYRQEWAACGGPDGWDPDLGPIDLTPYVRGANLDGEWIGLPSIGAAMRLRWSLWPFLRVGIWTLPARRITSFLARALNKVFWKRKKVFPQGGLVIAISGVDGSGKSTMLGAMQEFYSGFATVEGFQLGRPQGSILEGVRRLVSRGRRGRLQDSGSSSSYVKTVPRAVAAAILAWIRLRTARAAVRAARRGHLVLTDRWPSAELGKMDGPKISPDWSSLPWLVRKLGAFEEWTYSRMPSADVCVVLTVSIGSALARNKNRMKADKETDSEIRRRFEANQQANPIARKVIRFDNDGEFNVMREELIKAIWDEVASH